MTTTRRSRSQSTPVTQGAKTSSVGTSIVQLGLVSDVGVRQAIEHLPGLLRQGESVRSAASGFLEGRSGLVVATSERLLFVYRDQTPIAVRYSEIRHFRAKAGIVAAELVIEDSVGIAVIKQIHPRRRLVELAALLHDPSHADLRPEDPSAVTDEDSWRPKLRSKVSPLPARQSAPAQKVPSAPRLQELIWGTTQPSGPGSPGQGGWKPRFADSTTRGIATIPTSIAPAADSGSLARLRRAGSIPVGDSWIRPGEWLIAMFSEVLMFRSDPDRSTAGAAAVTNRRIVFLRPGAPAREWSCGVLVDLPVEGAPNRVALPDGSALDFPDATTARDFCTALRAATDLTHQPSLRTGEEGT